MRLNLKPDSLAMECRSVKHMLDRPDDLPFIGVVPTRLFLCLVEIWRPCVRTGHSVRNIGAIGNIGAIAIAIHPGAGVHIHGHIPT